LAEVQRTRLDVLRNYSNWLAINETIAAKQCDAQQEPSTVARGRPKKNLQSAPKGRNVEELPRLQNTMSLLHPIRKIYATKLILKKFYRFS